MGSIYKQKLSPFWWISYSQNGRRFQESSRSRMRREAERLLKEREGEIACGKTPTILFQSVPFDDILNGYLKEFRVEQRRSVKRAEQIVERLRKHFDGLLAIQVDTDRITEYMAKRRCDGAATATIVRELAILKCAFRLAKRRKPPLVQDVPYIPALEVSNTRRGFLEERDFQTLRQALPEYLRGITTFAYVLGCRSGELRGLTWGNVNLKEGYIQFEPEQTKTKRGRKIFLEPELREIIGGQFAKQGRARLAKGDGKKEKPSPYVFQHEGRQIGDFRKAWNRALMASLGREGYGSHEEDSLIFHDLRRSSVRNSIRSGIPQSIAMKISGHRTISIFQRYDITSDDDLREAALKVEQYRKAQL